LGVIGIQELERASGNKTQLLGINDVSGIIVA
jgi:hypothetical protein